MTRRLVLGGTRAGKSAHAERHVAASGRPVVYVATGEGGDAEVAERVAAHRARRQADWALLETTDVDAALCDAPDDAAVLVDDLEGWLVARMTAHGLWTDADVAPLGAAGRAAADAVVEEAASWWAIAHERAGDVVVVAGQPGLGIVPLGAATRRYVDLHGRVCERLASDADQVDLVVAGRVVALPPASRPGTASPAAAAADRAGSEGGGTAASDPLRDHGDTQVPHGTVDLAVNVLPGPPAWLRRRLADRLDDLAAYPDDTAARVAVARRHGRDPAEVVTLAGAAEAFWTLPSVLEPHLAACVHPGFTEPEAALRAARVPLVRAWRDPERDWALPDTAVPDAADLVVVGRPDNPTGVCDPVDRIASLCRPGRTVVVDEAFTEFQPDPDGLAGRTDLPGLVVVRSLTKLWGVPGLRVGYLLAERDLAAALRARRQPWAVDTLALTALTALVDEGAAPERAARAAAVAAARDDLVARLRAVPGVTAWDAAANFVLVRTSLPDLRDRLLGDGFAVRRGETFPGLDRHHVRVAVRTPAVHERLATAVARHLDRGPTP